MKQININRINLEKYNLGENILSLKKTNYYDVLHN